MAQLDIPLLEISTEDFDRSWTWFELVAGAKEWNDAKQRTVIPYFVPRQVTLLLSRFER